MKDQIHEAGMAIVAFISGLVPAALGAIVSLVYEAGLTWSQRFLQFAVGVTVSYFAKGFFAGAATLFGWSLNDYILQSVGFVLGMIAFKATPKFIAGCIERVAELPGAIFDRFLPRKDRP